MTVGRLQHQPEVLASTSSVLNQVAAQTIFEIDRPRQMSTGYACTEELGMLDAATDDVIMQPSTDDLDLGKLRHPARGRRRPVGQVQQGWREPRWPCGSARSRRWRPPSARLPSCCARNP